MRKKIFNKLKKYSLVFEEAYPYFISRIRWKSFSLEILKKIDFKKGDFFTMLPSDIKLDELHNLEVSILPHHSRVGNYEIITTLDHELSEFIHKFLSLNNLRSAIIENTYGKKGDTEIEIDGIFSKYIGDKEVYYIIPPSASINDISKAIDYSDEVWHFLAVLTEGIQIELFEESQFEKICKHIRYIITTAYDGEGYIFWQKNDVN